MPIDVLMVGFNPQEKGYDATPADFAAWKAHGASKAPDALRYFHRLFGVGPEHPWDSVRLANTRVWKWPSRTQEAADEEKARTCSRVHLTAETDAFKPRVILAYNDAAAHFYQERLPNLTMRPMNNVRPFIVRGISSPFDDWGYRTTLLHVSGYKARTTDEKREIREAIARELRDR